MIAKQNNNSQTSNMENKEKIILFKKISDIDKFNFYEYLSFMLNAWVWVWNSLEAAMEKIENEYFNSRINQLLIFILSWDSLSKAMKKDPDTFSDYEIAVIQAWETTWSLDKSLLNLSLKLKKSYDLKRKVKWALTYPMIIFIFLTIAIVVVLKFVIPALWELLTNSWTQMPLATQALLSTSNFVVSNFLYIILFIFTLFVLFVGYKNTVTWKEKIDSLILNLPLFWNVYKNFILANISSSMWNLITAWVPTLRMLSLVWKSSGSIIYEEIFRMVAKNVESWERVVESMISVDTDKYYFPSTFIQMLSVWEKTANMDEMSKKMHDQFTREVNYSLNNLTKWIEPIAILISSVFVLWFAFAIFWAIMKVTTSIG